MPRDTRVRGHFVNEWHDRRGAHTRIFLENADAQEVEEMFEKAHPSRFFESATMVGRRVDAKGQEGWENPMGKYMGGVPMMHTRIEEDPRGDGDGYDVRGTFRGFLRGEAPVDIDQVPGGVMITETGTRVRPDFTALPVVGTVQRAFEDNVPFFGGVARAMRQTGEAALGEVFGRVHTTVARHGGSAQTMASSINNRRR